MYDVTTYDVTTYDVTMYDVTMYDVTMYDVTMYGFRSRPIIRLKLTLVIVPEVINIEEPSNPCRLKDGTQVAW